MSRHLLTCITAKRFEDKFKAISDYFTEIEEQLKLEAKAKAKEKAEKNGQPFSEEDPIGIEFTAGNVTPELSKFFSSNESLELESTEEGIKNYVASLEIFLEQLISKESDIPSTGLSDDELKHRDALRNALTATNILLGFFINKAVMKSLNIKSIEKINKRKCIILASSDKNGDLDLSNKTESEQTYLKSIQSMVDDYDRKCVSFSNSTPMKEKINTLRIQIQQEEDKIIFKNALDDMAFKVLQKENGSNFTRDDYRQILNATAPKNVNEEIFALLRTQRALVTYKENLIKNNEEFKNKLMDLQAHIETAKIIIQNKKNSLPKIKSNDIKLKAIENILGKNDDGLPTFSTVKDSINKALNESKTCPLTQNNFTNIFEQYKKLTKNVLKNVDKIDEDTSKKWFGFRLRQWVSDGIKKFFGVGRLSTSEEIFKTYRSVFVFYNQTKDEINNKFKEHNNKPSISTKDYLELRPQRPQ